MINEMVAAITTKLQGGTVLCNLLALGTASIYHLQAPDVPVSAPYPYVVFNLQTGGPLNQTPKDMRDELFWVRGYSQVSDSEAGSIDGEISKLLHKGTVAVTGYTTMAVMRETDIALIENPPNLEKIWVAGGIYRFRLDN